MVVTPATLQARQWIAQAERIVVLTGAGISAESGIPTFRDPLTGLWARYRAEELATPEAFARDPKLVWDWYLWRRALCAEATSNAGHQAIARLLAAKTQSRLVTQNVDGLHARAALALSAGDTAIAAGLGEPQTRAAAEIIELHGNIHRNLCSATGREVSREWLRAHPRSPVPSPHRAGACVRPGVVWFGEALDATTLQNAIDQAAQAELMLIVGTSGLVNPAASLPLLTRRNGGRLVEINPEATPLSTICALSLRGRAAQVLPELV